MGRHRSAWGQLHGTVPAGWEPWRKGRTSWLVAWVRVMSEGSGPGVVFMDLAFRSELDCSLRQAPGEQAGFERNALSPTHRWRGSRTGGGGPQRASGRSATPGLAWSRRPAAVGVHRSPAGASSRPEDPRGMNTTPGADHWRCRRPRLAVRLVTGTGSTANCPTLGRLRRWAGMGEVPTGGSQATLTTVAVEMAGPGGCSCWAERTRRRRRAVSGWKPTGRGDCP